MSGYTLASMEEPKPEPERAPEPMIVTEQDLAAMARLARGLSPCEAWIDDHWREIDRHGNLVHPDQPPGPHRFGREAK